MTRVVLLVGTGRSGSTLLANLLGEVPGWFSAGEVRFLWARGLQQGRRCGCGRPVAECPVWAGVLEKLAADGRPVDPAHVVAELSASQQMRHLPEALLARGRYRRRLGGLPELMGPLYGAIAEVTGAEVVVDSSKLPLYGALLAASPGIELTVVHLVRSPFAAAYSWTSTKALDDGAARPVMEQRGAAKSSFLWSVWNLSAERLFSSSSSSYVRVRYEDLVRDPRGLLTEVLAAAGARDDLAFVDGTTARLSSNHTVAGNPDRMQAGPVTLRSDDRWVEGLGRPQRRMVRALTAPFARHFGYRADGLPRA